MTAQENVVMITFDVESQAYEAFTNLKTDAVSDSYTLIEAAVIKNENGQVTPQDAFDTGATFKDDTLKGGLIGAAVGILGGPFGILLGGLAGMMLGNDMDIEDAIDNGSLVEYVGANLGKDKVAIVALVVENEPNAFDQFFSGYSVKIMRWSADEVAQEIEQAEELQKQMAKEARKRLREARRNR